MKYETTKRDVPVPAPKLAGCKVVSIRVPWQYDVDAASLSSGLVCPEPTMTQQQFKDEVDINTIAKNFGITGKLPENVRMPLYQDFCDVEDFQTGLNAVRRAAQSFMQMPADVRIRFENDPQKFLEFCHDPANADEAKRLGLVKAPPISAQVPPPPEPPKPM